MVNLGDKVKDGVTGFSGTATARTANLNGPIQVMVENIDHEGKKRIVEWFDESRLEIANA